MFVVRITRRHGRVYSRSMREESNCDLDGVWSSSRLVESVRRIPLECLTLVGHISIGRQDLCRTGRITSAVQSSFEKGASHVITRRTTGGIETRLVRSSGAPLGLSRRSQIRPRPCRHRNYHDPSICWGISTSHFVHRGDHLSDRNPTREFIRIYQVEKEGVVPGLCTNLDFRVATLARAWGTRLYSMLSHALASVATTLTFIFDKAPATARKTAGPLACGPAVFVFHNVAITRRTIRTPAR